VSPCNTMRPGPRPTSISSGILIHAAVWPHKHWSKIGGLCPIFGEGALGHNLTQCGQGRSLPARQVSSLSVQPFGHNTPTSQTGQTEQDRQRSDSIGRTVLQTVAQNYRILMPFLAVKFNESSAVAQTGDRLATIDMGRKVVVIMRSL